MQGKNAEVIKQVEAIYFFFFSNMLIYTLDPTTTVF